MDRSEVKTLVEEALGDFAGHPGSVLYSGLDTVACGEFYIMGYNPADTTTAIRELPGDDRIQDNAYTMECWHKHGGTPCDHFGSDRRLKAGARVKHQNNVVKLCKALHPRLDEIVATEKTFSCNAIFASSAKTGSVNEMDWWPKCWLVHQRFLSIVRPKWIITLGRGWQKSAFALLLKEGGKTHKDVKYTDKMDGRTHGRYFEADLPLGGATSERLPVNVLGIPHPSYYAISDGLKEFIKHTVAPSA